jgi:pyrroloquinoline quinone biosynthesis protein D
MKRCNGARTIADITTDLELSFATSGLDADVAAFISMALAKNWLEIRA